MLNLPVHGPTRPDPLISSFERHLYAENRSARNVTTYLIAARQADAFLRERGTSLEGATRAGLEAFMADLLSRQMASTAATYTRSSRSSMGSSQLESLNWWARTRHSANRFMLLVGDPIPWIRLDRRPGTRSEARHSRAGHPLRRRASKSAARSRRVARGARR
jgi:hypothetical protein